MTFLNPYALFALIAASFPVLFHLFAQRRARRIEFSSIRFLKQLEKSSMRKVKLRQILLLILRTLLIACLVLAFARPALRGYLGGFFGSSHANTTAIVLFDNSASMTRADASGTYFKQAQDAAMKIADALEGGDEFVLIPLAHLERGKVYRRLHDPAEIRKAITELSVSDAPAKLADGLRIASSELAKTANVNREVYLISDNQARNLTGITSADSAMKLFDERTNVFSAKIGASTSLRNLTIDSIVSVSTVFESGRPLEFDVFIRNSGDVQIDNAIVSLFYNDERVAQRSVAALASGHSEKCTINALPKSAGILNVKAELEDDALAFDNARYLTLELPATSRVAIFTNTNADADFIRLALEQSLSDASIKPYSIELHRTEELRMLPSLRERVNAVMVELGGALEPEDAKALHDYVASGRGAAIFPLAGLDPAQFNSSIGSALSLPQLQSLEGSLASGEKYSGFGAFDLAHPFFTGMFDQNSNPNTPGIESPKIFEYYKFAATSLPLIKLTSGAAYLSDITAGKGHILLYSVPPTFSFSDLPRKPIFLPLVRRTAAYLASMKNNEESAPRSYTCGDPIDHTLPLGSGIQAGERLLVRGPNGFAERDEVNTSSNGALHIAIEQTPYAGIYSIYKDAESSVPLTTIAVNPPSDESNMQTVSESEMKAALEKLSASKTAYHSLDATSKSLTEQIRRSRFGVELWQIFLAIAVMCAVAEMLIAREGKHEPG